jgi:hypothetical protein
MPATGESVGAAKAIVAETTTAGVRCSIHGDHDCIPLCLDAAKIYLKTIESRRFWLWRYDRKEKAAFAGARCVQLQDQPCRFCAGNRLSTIRGALPIVPTPFYFGTDGEKSPPGR